jgi:hypothetical protein
MVWKLLNALGWTRDNKGTIRKKTHGAKRIAHRQKVGLLTALFGNGHR